MKRIVITGSTRGIGYGLADAFLARGCAVTVSGRTQAAADRAAAELAQRHGEGRVLACACDVGDPGQNQALWDAAAARFGGVDVWICNAGISSEQHLLWEHDPATVEAVLRTNLLGAIYGAQVAARGMLAGGGGQIYLMEGFGSGGMVAPGLTLYATTKAALRYLARALEAEARDTPLQIGAISPGMIVTDLVRGQYVGRPEAWARARRLWNILGDRVEDVTPWLAEQVLGNRRSGARIEWLSQRKAMLRFLTARFSRRDLFADEPGARP